MNQAESKNNQSYRKSAASVQRSMKLLQDGSHQLRIKRYYAMNFDFFEMEPHAHAELEIMYVVHGFCKINAWREETMQEIRLREGEYIFLDKGIKHQLQIEKNNRCRLLNLEMALRKSEENTWQLLTVSSSYTALCNSMEGYIIGQDLSRNLHTAITKLHGQMQTEAEEAEQQILQQLLLLQLLIELARQQGRVSKNERRGRYVNKAIEYLKAHFEEEIAVEDVSEYAGTSPAYLQRLMKEETKKTIIYCVNELRIEKARLLLETSSLPIIDIAVSIGFNNRQHFTHTFQKLVGCSPGLYRKQKGNDRVWNGF